MHLAEGGKASLHGKSYVEAIWNRGDGLLAGFLEFVYDEHNFIALPRLERGVGRRGRYEKVCFIEEGDITAKTCK